MYTWDLWGVAYILKGGCSDDGFEYFRAWLIARGRDFVAQALADPEGLGVAIDPGPGNYATKRWPGLLATCTKLSEGRKGFLRRKLR